MKFKNLIIGSNLLLASTFSTFVIAGQPPVDDVCSISNASSTGSGWDIGSRNYGCTDDNGGNNVVFTVSIPAACTSGGCGLIIDIHGATMNAELQNRGSKLRQYGATAISRGASTPYIVVQPNLSDLFDKNEIIDIGSLFGGAYANEMPVIEKFTDNVINRFNIDYNRIHMYGFSRGTHTANEYYCSKEKGEMYASFVMHAEKLKCNPQKNKPLLQINGRKDFLTPNNQSVENRRVIALLRSKNYKEVVIHSDPNWEKMIPEWLLLRGQYEHRRFTSGNKEQRFYESIEHSAKSGFLAGHCFPVKGDDYSGLEGRCLATFEIGEKIIDFFIKHELR
jgi:polyhydroxybutyrate depolymerase